MNIDGKNIILTGASSGIGLEILKLLVKYNDVKIIAVARDTDNIPIASNIFAFSQDVSTKEGIDNLFRFASKTFGHIDIFIANAGFAYLEKLDKPDFEHIQYIYSLNVFSPIYSLEKLIAQKGQRPKTFACTISGAGLASLPAYSLYCSTKAALHHFIQTYRYEKPKYLQITAVYPVATCTAFFDKATGKKDTPLPFPQQDACVVARKIVKGICKGRKRVFPSFLFRVFYPIGRMFPLLMKLYSLNEKRKVKGYL